MRYTCFTSTFYQSDASNGPWQGNGWRQQENEGWSMRFQCIENVLPYLLSPDFVRLNVNDDDDDESKSNSYDEWRVALMFVDLYLMSIKLGLYSTLKQFSIVGPIFVCQPKSTFEYADRSSQTYPQK